MFAFDEIVALGYRENVNLAQIRTFTDMESHEEKVYKAMREVIRRVILIKLTKRISSKMFLNLDTRKRSQTKNVRKS